MTTLKNFKYQFQITLICRKFANLNTNHKSGLNSGPEDHNNLARKNNIM
ncbi:uncharacterized protein METZ01_LOCUS11768 [marine metagenome]|uniref:Uncharacterized protein n=1 Tax=marine metagenome TaxID=408172 RepID=A0A381NXK2_9ZZZZ